LNFAAQELNFEFSFQSLHFGAPSVRQTGALTGLRQAPLKSTSNNRARSLLVAANEGSRNRGPTAASRKQLSSPAFSRSDVMNKYNHASRDDGAQEYARARIVEDAQGE